MPCNGRDGEHCSKSCPGFQPKKAGEADNNSKCKNCSHRKRAHSEPTVKEVLQHFGLNRLSKKPVSDTDARKETNAGFWTKEYASGEPSAKKHKSTKKNSSGAQMVKISSVQVITGGLDGEGEPRNTTCPTKSKVEKSLRYKLTVLKTRDGKELEFDVNWNQKRIDQWFRELFSSLFEFLDLRYQGQDYHWVLLGKDQRKLFAMNREIITGEELFQAKGPASRPASDQVIRIATKHQIPSSQYKSFDDAIESLMAGEELLSESEPEVDVPKRRQKSKAKTPPVKSASEEEADMSSEASHSDEGRDHPRVGRRSFSAVKQETTQDDEPLFGGYDSDIQETFPPPHEAFLGQGLSLKRSASPFGLLDDNERGRKKTRTRSEGSHISVASSDDETHHDSPSPRLRPASGSFQYDPALDPARMYASSTTADSTWTSSAITNSSGTSSTRTPSSLGMTSTTTQFAAGSSFAASSSGASQLPSARQTRTFSGPTLQKYIPKPPRQGLVVPKPADNPWA
ncbi:hypothetical protein FB451DRAFT_1173968 [Mycena latifolia]|nr:hypothetical protein FB451DRAFT_1173968 [Mycena latifolia]